MSRCRLCTCNDREGLIDHMAETMWESRRYGTLDDLPWETAPAYWQRTYRELAERALAGIETAA